MQISYFFDDGHHSAQIETTERFHGKGGWAIGTLTYPDGLQCDLAEDTDQYSFTNGGQEYKAACRAAWGAILAKKSGAKVAGLP